MLLFKKYHIGDYELGLHFREGDFVGLLNPGKYRFFDPLRRTVVDIVSCNQPWIAHHKLAEMIDSGQLDKRVSVIDLKDDQRGLVWIDDRFDMILAPGRYAYINKPRNVRVEIVDANEPQLRHRSLQTIIRADRATDLLDVVCVERSHVGVLFINGKYVETLTPGDYAFWRKAAAARVVEVDLRESTLEISGQEIMTSDKTSLRVNALVGYKIVDAKQAITTSDQPQQALYRSGQLALRSVVGSVTLDKFLTDKDVVRDELEALVHKDAKLLGFDVISVGIRDIILPGDMKDLMNKVTEARKVAEANLIFRSEETAAMRSQSNTAKLLADNPTLMRLRELEVLEKIATNNKLNVVLGEKGLADRVVNLL